MRLLEKIVDAAANPRFVPRGQFVIGLVRGTNSGESDAMPASSGAAGTRCSAARHSATAWVSASGCKTGNHCWRHSVNASINHSRHWTGWV